MADLFDDPAPGANAPEFTVSEISGALKRVIEGEFGRIRVRGEVGRVFRARSGHLYYDLKDDRNVLSCTTWKGQIDALSVVPEEGLEVVATGRLTTFGAQSKYNMNVEELAVAGVGALMAMLEKRKKALEAEGLFAPERKQPLPYLPEVIGVVTSPSGAVIRDILHRLRERFPRKVLIWPVQVQGKDCAPQVANAIRGFNALTPGGALPRPDVIIVARGGGSVEDLWGFNEEEVVRAAAESRIPLVSAVGHETDTTLIDYAADRRAPTPTAAAEMAVPVRLELLAAVGANEARLKRASARGIAERRARLEGLKRVLPRPETLLSDPRQRLDRAGETLPRALSLLTERKAAALSRLTAAIRPAALGARLQSERSRLFRLQDRLEPALGRAVTAKRERLAGLLVRLRPQRSVERLRQEKQDVDRAGVRLDRALRAGLDALASRLEGLERMRSSLGYRATLARGYAVVRAEGRVVTDAGTAGRAGDLEIEFRDGRIRAVTGGSASGGGPKKSGQKGQGSLF